MLMIEILLAGNYLKSSNIVGGPFVENRPVPSEPTSSTSASARHLLSADHYHRINSELYDDVSPDYDKLIQFPGN